MTAINATYANAEAFRLQSPGTISRANGSWIDSTATTFGAGNNTLTLDNGDNFATPLFTTGLGTLEIRDGARLTIANNNGGTLANFNTAGQTIRVRDLSLIHIPSPRD